MKKLAIPTTPRPDNSSENSKTEMPEQVEQTHAVPKPIYQTAVGQPYSVDQLLQNSIMGSFPSFAVGQTFKVPTTAVLSKVDVWAEARVAGDNPLRILHNAYRKQPTSGWLEERVVNKHYYRWLDQGKQRRRYVPVKKVGKVTQMISDRCGVEEILALLKAKNLKVGDGQ